MKETINEDNLIAPIEERLSINALASVIRNFESDDIEGYNEIVIIIKRSGSSIYALKKLDLDLKNKVTQLTQPLLRSL